MHTIDEFSIMPLVQMLIGIFAFSGSPVVEGQSSDHQGRREDIPNRNPAHFLRLRIARRWAPTNRRREEWWWPTLCSFCYNKVYSFTTHENHCLFVILGWILRTHMDDSLTYGSICHNVALLLTQRKKLPFNCVPFISNASCGYHLIRNTQKMSIFIVCKTFAFISPSRIPTPVCWYKKCGILRWNNGPAKVLVPPPLKGTFSPCVNLADLQTLQCNMQKLRCRKNSTHTKSKRSWV